MKKVMGIGSIMVMSLMAVVLAISMSVETKTGRYTPVRTEGYTYGDFDELRMDKVYRLSVSEDVTGIPTADFVQNGRLYELEKLVRASPADLGLYAGETIECAEDAVFYVATFKSREDS